MLSQRYHLRRAGSASILRAAHQSSVVENAMSPRNQGWT
jgi:hypothetical protein